MDFPYRLHLVTPPAEEPVTAEEVCEAATIDPSALVASRGRIESFISSEREWVESQTGRQLVQATYDLLADRFPPYGYAICLPRPPLISVDSIKYIDEAGVLQTWPTTEYSSQILDGPKAQRSRVWLAWGKSFPATRAVPGAVAIRFTCGYGPAAAVPAALRNANIQRVAERYAFREDQTTGTIVAQNSITSERIVSPYREFGRILEAL